MIASFSFKSEAYRRGCYLIRGLSTYDLFFGDKKCIMFDMDLIFIVGNVALVCTIASCFAGLPICINFFREKSTSNVSVLPFVAGGTSASLWLFYSILLENGMLQFVNATQVFLQIIYISGFYINTTDKKLTFQKAFSATVFLLITYSYAFHITDPDSGKLLLGYLASIASILACGAPLSRVKDVMRTQSADCLPFPIITATLIVTSLWYIYGILTEDRFIQVPNLIGAILSVIQLSLFIIYPSREKELSSQSHAKKE